MSYVVLRGRWCNIIVLNVHAPSEEKSDSSKDSFCEELEQVLDHFPKYHMKIILRDFNAKVGRGNIFKQTIGNYSLHQDSNVNGVRTALTHYNRKLDSAKQTTNFLLPLKYGRFVSAKACRSVIQGGADKTLVRLTSRCRRTEWIVSLESGVRSCAELQDFSCYRG